MDYTKRNPDVFMELEAIIESTGYGGLDVTLDLHDKKITHLTVYGKKRQVYKKTDDMEALSDILKRIKVAIDKEQNTRLVFTLEVKNGKIEETKLVSSITRNYEA